MSDAAHDEFEKDFEMVKKATTSLGEHFDSVQIFVTRYSSQDRTLNGSWGEGNWFSRYGLVREWLISEEERTKEKQRDRSI